jgi:hypothetical protein
MIKSIVGDNMEFRLLGFIAISLTLILFVGACVPSGAPATVDIAGTVAVQLASAMLTQTAAAYSPTSPPLPTPMPVTDTLVPTENVTLEPTKDPSIRTITVINLPDPQPACRVGPGDSYEMTSVINTPKVVELLGIGSVPGWYVIKNPYFGTPCWLPADIIEIDPAMDLSAFPVMSP